VAHQPRHDTTLEKVLLDDLGDVFDLDVLVEDAVRVDERHGADGAGSETTRLDDLHLAGQALVFQLLGEGGAHGHGARRDAAAAGAHEHLTSDLIHTWFLLFLGFRVRRT